MGHPEDKAYPDLKVTKSNEWLHRGDWTKETSQVQQQGSGDIFLGSLLDLSLSWTSVVSASQQAFTFCQNCSLALEGLASLQLLGGPRRSY